ncbi:MAG: hypothetical protein COT73_10735 [Bdellovibrio sp. CG10_big_fil_rev_8_21_14_0_10_47_8]|nr:MAG: hypothetical protein COT73_10735 [Bdellovibrio sp. CG10_big_fil_rev_8_21_14_0_10_47_8]
MFEREPFLPELPPLPIVPEDRPGDPLDDLFPRSGLNFEESQKISTSFHRGPRSRAGSALIMWSLAAAFIDTLLVLSMSCVFLLCFCFLLKMGFAPVIVEFKTTMMGLALLLIVGVFVSYLLVSRIFLGFTIGEWACGLRLGSLQQRHSSSYALKVCARTTLVLLTGGVLLPALSLMAGEDIAGLIVRLPLIFKKS